MVFAHMHLSIHGHYDESVKQGVLNDYFTCHITAVFFYFQTNFLSDFLRTYLKRI